MVLHLQEIANKLGLNISYDALNDEYICLLSAAMVSLGGWAVLPAWASLSSPWLSHIYVSETKPWSGGVFWCSLRQGAPGFNSTPGAPWAAGHRTWLFRKGWITTGSGVMKDSVLSAWFFKEEIRTKFPWGHIRIQVSLLKTLQTTKTGWSSRHTPETLTHHIKKQGKNQSLSVADCPSWPLQEGHGPTRIQVIDRRVNCVESQQSPFLHSLNIYQAQSEAKRCSVTATEAESWQDREGTLGTSELPWLVILFYFFLKRLCVHISKLKRQARPWRDREAAPHTCRPASSFLYSNHQLLYLLCSVSFLV